jgi:putative multiple sugar transport system ATP-binding protein
LPENCKEEGVVLDQQIRWNIGLAALRFLRRGLRIDRAAEAAQDDSFRKRLRIKAPSIEQNSRRCRASSRRCHRSF